MLLTKLAYPLGDLVMVQAHPPSILGGSIGRKRPALKVASVARFVMAIMVTVAFTLLTTRQAAKLMI